MTPTRLAPRLRPSLLTATALLATVSLARCTCGTGGDEPAVARCEIDLSGYPTTGTGAVAKVATASDLLTGEAASGVAGDFVLANDKVRVIVEQPGRVIGPQPFGGNLIDGDVVRAAGEAGQERFGELGLLFNLGRTVDVERVEIVRDGSAGGAAILAATGLDQPLDFIHLQGLLAQYLDGLDLPDADLDLPLRITHWYVLEPGSDAVQVVTAMCNDGTESIALPVGDLVDSGGDVTGLAGRSGFGTTSGDPSALLNSLGESPGEPFFAWVGAGVTYGYVPDGDTNQVLTVSGVTGTLLDTKSVLAWTRGPDSPPQDAKFIEPGASVTFRRDFVVARSPSGVFDHFYARRGKVTGTVSGQVARQGTPVAGARVTALQGEVAVSLFETDAQGRFSGKVPVGVTTLQADDGVTRSPTLDVTVAANVTADAPLTLPTHGTLLVRLRDNTGAKIPGKVTVACPGSCAVARSGVNALRFRDTKSDALPTTNGVEVFDFVYVGPTGETTLSLPSGEYRVWVSHGPEWTLHDETVTVGDGAQMTVDASLTHVVDTAGWVSGDLHVHAINSPDSPIVNDERLRNFMAEGVDVIVSTDHDFITDFAPTLATIPDGAKWLRPVVGVELTTFDYGHYNGFPIERNAASRNGGAVDWAGGLGPGFAPKKIFESLQAFPGEQVVQLNHPNSGLFSAFGLDTRTFWTRKDPAEFRIAPIEKDATTGDTRLFDDGFTAFEVLNGFSVSKFETVANTWFALLNRGIVRTGTAVSDTHKRHGNAGHPRTWVKVGTDDPAAIDLSTWAHALNAGQAIGSNGPFLEVTATAGDQHAGPGELLATGARTVTVAVDVRMPAWISVDRLRLFVNTPGTEADARGIIPSALPAAQHTIELETVVERGGLVHRARASVDVVLEKDAWIVAVVDGPGDLFPVIGKGSVKPFAYANPVRIDLDGNGWSSPIDLAAERAAVGRLPTDEGQPLSRPVTEYEFREVLGRHCNDDEH